jgi:hypothetical protein
MLPRFRHEKALHAAALLLEWAEGTLGWTSLNHLLYLADREALLRWGIPITFSRLFWTPRGPELSDLHHLADPGLDRPGSGMLGWKFSIVPREIRLPLDRPAEALSENEVSVLAEVFDAHGAVDEQARLDRIRKTLPERTTQGGVHQIAYREILMGAGWADAAVADLEQQLQSLARLELLSDLKRLNEAIRRRRDSEPDR